MFFGLSSSGWLVNLVRETLTCSVLSNTIVGSSLDPSVTSLSGAVLSATFSCPVFKFLSWLIVGVEAEAAENQGSITSCPASWKYNLMDVSHDIR